MSALSNDARERQRLELLDEVAAERFGAAPWREAHKRPTPLAMAITRTKDTPQRCAARAAALVSAMDDWHPTKQRAA